MLSTSFVSLLASAVAWEQPLGKGWQKAAPPPWEPHTGSIATPLADGSTLLLGGQAGRHGGANFDCANCTKEVWRFEHRTDTWTNLSADVPWAPRWGHSVVAAPDDRVWMLMGCCEIDRPTVMLRDVWTYNPSAATPWLRMEVAPPHEGLQAFSIALWNDDIWVVGGWSQHRGTMSVITKLSTKSLKWEMVLENNKAPWVSRADHGSAISPDGKYLFVYGGQSCIKNNCQNWERLADTWRAPLADVSPGQWKQLGELRAARSSPGVAVLAGRWIITMGGHWTPPTESLGGTRQEDVEGMQRHHQETEFSSYNDVLLLDMANGGEDGWATMELQAPWPNRDDAASCSTTDGSLLIFGGGTLYGGGGYHQDVWRLEDAAKKYQLSGHDEL